MFGKNKDRQPYKQMHSNGMQFSRGGGGPARGSQAGTWRGPGGTLAGGYRGAAAAICNAPIIFPGLVVSSWSAFLRRFDNNLVEQETATLIQGTESHYGAQRSHNHAAKTIGKKST